MAYVSNIKDISYNHQGTQWDGRFNDLYVDGDIIGPSVVGPTGPTGPTGPAGPSFIDGWSVTLTDDVTVVDPITRVPFDTTVNGFLGDFSEGSYSGTIDTAGKYILTAQVGFTWHAAGSTDNEVAMNVIIDGSIRGRSTCIYNITPTSPTQSLSYARVVYLTAGQSIHVELVFPSLNTNTIAGGPDTYFSCQRIA